MFLLQYKTVNRVFLIISFNLTQNSYFENRAVGKQQYKNNETMKLIYGT